jgi:hypothetical protein
MHFKFCDGAGLIDRSQARLLGGAVGGNEFFLARFGPDWSFAFLRRIAG